VKPADCIADAAASVAWTLANIGNYGGDPKKIFVTGISAGGYLTAMVGMDARWLVPHGFKPGASAA
jgi:acetyl esterase/lipase